MVKDEFTCVISSLVKKESMHVYITVTVTVIFLLAVGGVRGVCEPRGHDPG